MGKIISISNFARGFAAALFSVASLASASTPITLDYKFQESAGAFSGAGSVSLGTDSGSYSANIVLPPHMYYVGDSDAYITTITVNSFTSTSATDTNLWLYTSPFRTDTTGGYLVPAMTQLLSHQIASGSAPFTFTLIPGIHSFLFAVSPPRAEYVRGDVSLNFTVNASVTQSISPVPELSNYAMLLSGIAVVGSAVWRRRQIRNRPNPMTEKSPA